MPRSRDCSQSSSDSSRRISASVFWRGGGWTAAQLSTTARSNSRPAARNSGGTSAGSRPASTPSARCSACGNSAANRASQPSPVPGSGLGEQAGQGVLVGQVGALGEVRAEQPFLGGVADAEVGGQVQQPVRIQGVHGERRAEVEVQALGLG